MHFRPGRRSARSVPSVAVALAAALAPVAALGLAACSSTPAAAPPTSSTTSTTAVSGTTTTGAPATSTTAPAGPTQVSVYFLRTDTLAAAHRTVPATPQIGAAAVTALLAGPTAAERAAGLATAIPAGTRFLGLSITAGTATVDLSSQYESGGGSLSMSARLAQVVFTLTQFPTVGQVQFELDGRPVQVFGGEGLILDHPVGRANYEELQPPILVESPAFGDTVVSPLRVRGTANVFEARLHVQLIDADGQVLVDRAVTASSGTGTRGTFDVTLTFGAARSGPGTLVAYSLSPKDGSRINIVQVPVRVSAA